MFYTASAAIFRPRNKSVLENINSLSKLSLWSNPTNWTEIIESTSSYTELTDEKESFKNSSKKWPKKVAQ